MEKLREENGGSDPSRDAQRREFWEKIKHAFIAGLRDPKLRSALLLSKATNLESLLSEALMAERELARCCEQTQSSADTRADTSKAEQITSLTIKGEKSLNKIKQD